MARLYANENFPFPVVEELRRLGHDVLTTQDAGRAGQAILDEDVLAFADEQQRAVLTLNRRHFARLHTSASTHHGIIICSFDPHFVGLASRIHEALQQQPRVANQLLRINRSTK